MSNIVIILCMDVIFVVAVVCEKIWKSIQRVARG